MAIIRQVLQNENTYLWSYIEYSDEDKSIFNVLGPKHYHQTKEEAEEYSKGFAPGSYEWIEPTEIKRSRLVKELNKIENRRIEIRNELDSIDQDRSLAQVSFDGKVIGQVIDQGWGKSMGQDPAYYDGKDFEREYLQRPLDANDRRGLMIKPITGITPRPPLKGELFSKYQKVKFGSERDVKIGVVLQQTELRESTQIRTSEGDECWINTDQLTKID